MSITDEISCRVDEGRLAPILPVSSNMAAVKRRIFVGAALHHQLNDPNSDDPDRMDDLKADLVSFLTLNWIPPSMLRHLKPKKRGVWAFRSHQHDPQIRIFGHFAAKDVFVALFSELRANLGGRLDPDWHSQIRRVEHEWKQLFPAYTPLKSSDASKLFTGALDEKYFKN